MLLPVSSVEPTALPKSMDDETSTQNPVGRAVESPKDSDAVLRPSFTVSIDEDDEDSGSLYRQKRFLFLLTSTITTYSFVTTTRTSTLSLYSSFFQYFFFNGGLLTCRPSNIGLC